MKDVRHWSGCCSCLTREDEMGRLRCTVCGCIVHHEHPADTSNEGSECATIEVVNNEGRVSACDAPSPLDALGAP